MQLSKGKSKGGDYSKVLQEENVPDTPVVTSNANTNQNTNDLIPAGSKIHTSVQERIVLVAENDGGLKNLEVKGELSLTVFDPNCAKIKVHVSQGENGEFQFKVTRYVPIDFLVTFAFRLILI